MKSTPWSVVGVAVFVGCGGVGEDSARGDVEERLFAEGVGEGRRAVLTLEDVAAATGTEGEDWIDPELAAEYGRRILANIEEM